MGDLKFGFVLISFVGIQSQPRCQKHFKKYKCKYTKILREKSSLSKKCRWSSTAVKREAHHLTHFPSKTTLPFIELWVSLCLFLFNLFFFKVNRATPSPFWYKEKTHLDDGWVYTVFQIDRHKQTQHKYQASRRLWCLLVLTVHVSNLWVGHSVMHVQIAEVSIGAIEL